MCVNDFTKLSRKGRPTRTENIRGKHLGYVPHRPLPLFFFVSFHLLARGQIHTSKLIRNNWHRKMILRCVASAQLLWTFHTTNANCATVIAVVILENPSGRPRLPGTNLDSRPVRVQPASSCTSWCFNTAEFPPCVWVQHNPSGFWRTFGVDARGRADHWRSCNAKKWIID